MAGESNARRFLRMHEAFRRGDLDALRSFVDDPASIPNGPVPGLHASCLVYAIYHSPLTFVRRLLEMGADPNAPIDDGFPPLIAAIASGVRTSAYGRRQLCSVAVRILLGARHPRRAES